MNLFPSALLHMIDRDGSPTERISESSVVNRARAQFNRVLYTHIILVLTIQDTIRVRGPRPDREHLGFKSLSVTIDIVQSGTLGLVKA
jgi:hypothetical protein